MTEERGRALGTSIKDTWTKPKRGRIKVVKWGRMGWRGMVWGQGMETTVLEKQ